MAGSILTETKKVIGIAESDTSFDPDIIMHINSTFSILQQLGLGPADGYLIVDDTEEWDDYISADNALNMIRSYLFLRVRMLFDPPTTSFMIDAMNKQLSEYEWRISLQREWALNPVDPLVESGD